MRRFWKIFSVLVVVSVALVVSGIVVLKSTDFSQYKGVLVEEVKKATGRDLVIKGDFRLDVGLDTYLAVEDVSFANASWGSRPHMVKLERLNVDVKILPLLMNGDIQVERLILVGLDALLETDAKGRGNWEFAAAKPDQPESAASMSIPVIETVSIRDLRFAYRDGRTGKTTKAAVEELSLAGTGETSPLDFTLSAKHDGLSYRASGRLGPIRTLLEGGRPFPVDVTGDVAGVLVQVKGTVDRPREAEGMNLNVSLSGQNLEDTIRNLRERIPGLANVSVPPIGAFRAEMRVTGSPERLGLRGIDAGLGSKEKIQLTIKGDIADAVAVKGLDLRLTTAGGELADTVRLLRPYVPALKDLTVPPVGPYTVSGRLKGSLESLSATDLDVNVGEPAKVKVSLKGGVADVLAAKGIDVSLSLAGKDLSAVEKIIAAPLPNLPPFTVKVDVKEEGKGSQRKAKAAFDAEIGASAFAGQGAWWLQQEKPTLGLSIAAKNIDLDEMFPKDESAPQPPRDRAQDPPQPAKLFSAAPFPVQALRALDAEVDVKVDRLKLHGSILEKLEGRASLKSGRLEVDHLFATVEKGRFVSKLTFDARSDKPVLDAKLNVREFSLGRVLEKADMTDALTLVIDAELEAKGQGRSPHHVMASLNGKTRVVGRTGRIKSSFLAGAVSGVSDAIPWFRNADANKINCFVGRFDIEKGMAKSKVILLDTGGMSVTGKGRVDLGKETLDLTFVPKAKKTSLASFALPMHFTGPLTAPKASTSVSKEAIATVTNVVTTVGGVLLGPVGLLGVLGKELMTEKKDDPCVTAMKTYSQSKAVPQSATTPASEPTPASQEKKKADEGVAGTVKRNTENVIEGAGEAVKGIGKAFEGLFGGK